MAPIDATFGLSEACKSDTRSPKVNLAIGVYSNDDGSPFVYPVVHEVKISWFESIVLNNWLFLPLIFSIYFKSVPPRLRDTLLKNNWIRNTQVYWVWSHLGELHSSSHLEETIQQLLEIWYDRISWEWLIISLRSYSTVCYSSDGSWYECFEGHRDILGKL